MRQDGIGVLLVDPSTLARQGLASLLEHEPTIVVIGDTDNTADAHRLIGQHTPDVLLADVPALANSRPENLRFFQSLSETVPDCRLIVLTSSDRDSDFFEALRLGAMGYLLKNCDVDELISAIRLSVRGEYMTVPDYAKNRLIRIFGAHDTMEREQTSIGLLTRRELVVLELVGRGETNRQIARRLYISENTVKAHTRKMMEKLGLSSKAELVAWSARRAASTESLAADVEENKTKASA